MRLLHCAGEGKVNFYQGALWRIASNTLGAGGPRPRGLVPAVSTAQRQEEGSHTEVAGKERGLSNSQYVVFVL